MNYEKLKEFLSYSPETGKFVWIKKPSKRTLLGSVAGSKQSYGYTSICFEKRNYLAHRVAWFFTYGTIPMMIDHINGDPSDNRIENLRESNPAENSQNQRKAHHKNKTGYLGVYYFKRRYAAKIHFKGKNYHLGRFDTPELAHQAYLEAKRKFHGGCTL